MKKRTLSFSAAAVLGLSALLAGGGASAAAPAAHRVPSQAGDTLVNALPTAWAPDLIPDLAFSAYSSAISSMNFLWLIGVNQGGDLSPVGGVVDKWSIAPDHKTYTFWINPKMKWSNGQPVTSEDVKLGIAWLASKSYNGPLQGGYGYLVQGIAGGANPLPDGQVPSGFKIISPSEFQITTQNADPAILNSQLSEIYPLPSSVLGKIPMSKWNKISFDTAPTVGDGPWVVSKVVQGQTVVMKANPYFAWGKPYIPTYEWQVITVDQQPGALAKGTLNMATIDPKYYAGLKKYPNIAFDIVPHSYDYNYLVWRLNNAQYGYVFRNVLFRQACMYAINRMALIKAFDKGFGYPQNTFLPDVSKWYDTNLPHQYRFSPSKANQLLDEAGLKIDPKTGWRTTPDGKPFTPTLTYNTGSTSEAQEMQAIAQMLQAVHIHAKVNPPIDFNTLSHMQQNDANGKQPLQGFLEGVQFSGSNDPDPRGFLRTTDAFNDTTWDWSYKDKYTELNDKLIAEQASVPAFNYAYRKNVIDQLQALYNERVPMIFLDNPSSLIAYTSSLKNVRFSPFGQWEPWTMYFAGSGS